MVDETIPLELVRLRKLDARLRRLEDNYSDLSERLLTLEKEVALLSSHRARQEGRIADVLAELDWIRRRLEINDGPT
jgi:predicted nuclease with TOPRIM domain